MNRRSHSLSISAVLVIVFATAAIAQQTVSAQKAVSDGPPKSRATTTPDTLTTNDQLMLHVFRTLHSAEVTFETLTGRYGGLQELGQRGLISPQLATGMIYGYLFQWSYTNPTSQSTGDFAIQALPYLPAVGPQLRFYVNESCDIRASYRKSSVFGEGINDPVIEPCGTSKLTENERLSIVSLRQIYDAEIIYQSTFGGGQFGTLADLFNNNLVTSGFAASQFYRDYHVNALILTPEPAGFALTVVPSFYGRSGRRSFYIDQTGVLRGGDKNGLPANENDPPIL